MNPKDKSRQHGGGGTKPSATDHTNTLFKDLKMQNSTHFSLPTIVASLLPCFARYYDPVSAVLFWG